MAPLINEEMAEAGIDLEGGWQPLFSANEVYQELTDPEVVADGDVEYFLRTEYGRGLLIGRITAKLDLEAQEALEQMQGEAESERQE